MQNKMDKFPFQPRIDPVAMLSIAEIRGVIDLWQSKQNLLEVSSTINNTADLAVALGITEYEVAGLLSQVRKPIAAVPEQAADAKAEKRMSWWIAIPALLFAMMGFWGLFQPAAEENKPQVAAQVPIPVRTVAPSPMTSADTSPLSATKIFSPEPVNPSLTIAEKVRKPYGDVKYLSPEEVKRKARVYEAKPLPN